MINKSQSFKGKTKLKFYKNLSSYSDGMKFQKIQSEEYLFVQKARSISKIHHEEFLIKKFLQTKPQVKKMHINCYDLCYSYEK